MQTTTATTADPTRVLAAAIQQAIACRPKGMNVAMLVYCCPLSARHEGPYAFCPAPAADVMARHRIRAYDILIPYSDPAPLVLFRKPHTLPTAADHSTLGKDLFAPIPEWTGDPDTILVTRNNHGEVVCPAENGEDLSRCLYDLRNGHEVASTFPNGTPVILDGQVIGHFKSCHYIPAR